MQVVVVVVMCGHGGDSLVMGDFFERPPRLFGSFFSTASYCLSFGLFRGFKLF